jgi:hypothetical protein
MVDYSAEQIRQLATEYLTFFAPLEREGNIDTYVKVEGYPQELQDLCIKAHGDMMVDDYKYNYIVDSLSAIADSETDDLEEIGYELEPDIYNWHLLQWLSSNLNRAYYIDECIEELYSDIPAKEFNTYKLIGLGQLAEKQEVFNLVLQSLIEIAEDLEETEEENNG